MPQGPIGTNVATKPSGAYTPLKVDSSGALFTTSEAGGDAVTIANGADVTQGNITDTAYAGSGNATVVAALKGLYTELAATLVANTSPPSRALNVGAAATIKGSAGIVGKVSILAPGSTGGAFTINDCVGAGNATTANQVWTMLYNATANVAGLVVSLDFPCTTGITISAVPTGGTPLVAISFR